MYHIILNPTSGKKKSVKNLVIVERILSERGIPFEVHQTNAVHDATDIARRLTEDGEQEIIVLGGDGTLHEVLGGIADLSACHLGLVPSGTGNDFASKVGIPMDVEKALALIIDGSTKATDYLEVDGIRCMNVTGVGMDVEVLERCQKGKMKGKLKYLVSLVKSLFSFKGLPVTIESDGVSETRDVLIAAACNGAQFGGGIPICPVAQVDDGKMDVVIVDCIGGKMKIINAFIYLLKGKILQYPAAKHFLCERVRFIPQKFCSVQLDGELYSGLNFDVKICQGLQFYRP